MVLIIFWTLQLENGAQEHIIMEELHQYRSNCYESWLKRSAWMHLRLWGRSQSLRRPWLVVFATRTGCHEASSQYTADAFQDVVSKIRPRWCGASRHWRCSTIYQTVHQEKTQDSIHFTAAGCKSQSTDAPKEIAGKSAYCLLEESLRTRSKCICISYIHIQLCRESINHT